MEIVKIQRIILTTEEKEKIEEALPILFKIASKNDCTLDEVVRKIDIRFDDGKKVVISKYVDFE